MKDKSKKLIEKIGVLKDKLGKLRFDYDLKSSKIEMKIRLAEENVLDLRMKLLKDKEVPKELEYEFGIRWISPDVDPDENLMRATNENVTESISIPEDSDEDEIGIEILE